MAAAMTRIAGAALACMVTGGLALAAPAGAAGHPRSTAGMHAVLSGPAAPGVHSNLPVTNYGAGYFTYPGSAYGVASASATFTMPAITCVRATDHEWLLPGIWVYDASGALSQQVDVNFNCNLGTKLQEAVICISGVACDQSLVVAANDRIVASLAYTATHTIGTVRDLTAGTVAQVVGGPITTDYTIFVGDEGPHAFGVDVIPRFTKVPFTAVQINGEYLARATGVTGYDLQTGSYLQISTSAIGATGQSFTTTFVHPA